MTIKATEFKDKISQYISNPISIQRTVVDMLEASVDGEIEIVDPTNPFTMLLGAAIQLQTVAIDENRANNRKQYSSAAQTVDELYMHMSDVDYVDRFATPSRTSFTVALGKEELYTRAVDTDVGSIRKLTIPRNSMFSVAGYDFTMQYPIDIRIMGHGGLQIVYDVENPSPLETLESNTVNWWPARVSGTEYIFIEIPVSQFKISTQYSSLSLSTGFSKTFSFADEFYYCRVYQSAANGTWKEIKTTHSDQVFDPNEVTALLKLYKGGIGVEIPAVYFTTGLITGELRVDVFTTKGSIDVILGNYAADAFVATWVDHDDPEAGKYSSPIKTFNTITLFSDQTVSGGSGALSFEELRTLVMTNSLGAPDIPITPTQLPAKISALGYNLVKNIERITNRQFLATRDLPLPDDGSISSGMSTAVKTVPVIVSDIVNHPSVADNGDRVTLKPSVLYLEKDGVMSIVNQTTVDSIRTMSLDARVTHVNNERYGFTPFHYVLDMKSNTFDLRPYYLENPAITAKSFIAENDTAEIEVAVGSYSLQRTTTGYKLTVVTRSGDSFKALNTDNVYVQASILPTGEIDRAFINGELVGTLDGELVYEFAIETNYDIDDANDLHFTSFKMYSDIPRVVASSLITDIDIVVVVADHTAVDMVESDIDDRLGNFMLPANVIGVVQERLRVRFGSALTSLWSNARSVASSLVYKTYPVDVPDLYEENVYELDETGKRKLVTNPDTGKLELVLLHSAGEERLHENGQVIYKYRKGDVMLDENGEPVIESPRRMQRYIDLMLFDGAYYFATETNAVDYAEELPVIVVGWLTEDFSSISKRLLENTKLYFYPKATFGNIDVMVNDGVTVTIPSEQSFRIRTYVTNTTYKNAALRASMTQTIIDTLNEVLSLSTVSVTDMQSRIKAKVGDTAIALEISNLGPDGEYTAFTVLDESTRATIRKRLVALPDGTLSVQDDVTVDFIRHELAS